MNKPMLLTHLLCVAGVCSV